LDEIIINLHMHTNYSDGSLNHSDIVNAALRKGIDVVVVTDHNVWVNGPEGYYREGKKQTLLLVGEEIHDQARQPQMNHLLVIGARRELATLAWDRQKLLDGVKQSGGLGFLAHPIEIAAPAIGEDDISWVDWQVHGYTGIELWNAMSEFKSLLKNKMSSIYYAYNPKMIARGPFQATLRKWDELLVTGVQVVAIGGTDAHALDVRMGPLHRIVFPFEFHFQTVNTHLLLSNPLTGNVDTDRRLVMEALAKGHAFIGYDLPSSTRGFRFSGQGIDKTAIMGDEINLKEGITFQIHLPRPTDCHLFKDGKMIKTWHKRESCTFITNEVGVYRVEVYINYLGRRRGWIYSNPIYVRK
jgi:hypothetical protein